MIKSFRLDLNKGAFTAAKSNTCTNSIWLKHLRLPVFRVGQISDTTMPFTFVYRTADMYLSAISAVRERWGLSCSVHKAEWHTIYILLEKLQLFEYNTKNCFDVIHAVPRKGFGLCREGYTDSVYSVTIISWSEHRS